MVYLTRKKMSRMLTRIHPTVKHVIDWADLSSTGGTAFNHTIIKGNDNPVLANTTDIAYKSKVKALHIDLNFALAGAGATDAVPIHCYIGFAGQMSLGTMPNANAVGASGVKNFIYWQGMVMPHTNAPAKIVGMVRIPKKYSIHQIADLTIFQWYSADVTAGNIHMCGKVIYKEYRT